MPIAVECPAGHKRAIHEDHQGQQTQCSVAGCPHMVSVPERATKSTKPCYQTGRLEVYATNLRALAQLLFDLLHQRAQVRGLAVATEGPPQIPGGYSILSRSSDERAGKIVIYEDGVG